MTTVAQPTPRPCPFCGDSPLEDRIEPHEHSPMLMGIVPLPYHYPGSWSIECVPCGFRIFSHDSREEAVAKWNRRNSFDALTEALKECEDYFDNRADVNDGSYGEPIPNTEMRLLEVVRKALKVSK